MNVLFICHRFPYPPKRGGKIRPFNVIKHLYQHGHAVTVASLVRSREEQVEGGGIRDYCKEYISERVSGPVALARMLVRLPGRTPSSMGYFYSPRLARRITAKLESTQFDLIYVHCSSVAQYVAHVAGIPKVLDIGDVDSQKWLSYANNRKFPMSMGYRLEGLKLERAERMLARQFDLCTCTTKAELETLDGFETGASTGWFPNGVDADYFAPGTEPCEPDTISFVGRMDYYPNQQAMINFCTDVLPAIRARRPGIQLQIVGANPSRTILQLGRMPAVSVTGSVPDVRPYVRRSVLTVAPLSIARGTQNKILESMAMGVPVVASREAAGGVDAVPGDHLLTASSASEYVDNILRLLENPAERARLAGAGRERVLSNHDWQRSMERLDLLLKACISRVAGKDTDAASRAPDP